jgi:phenylpyruvate tautomerase PptA (4-oxalocrotonate tautomerase family)
MPFINSKVSVSMTEDKKETIKKALGEAIQIIPGKSENWLMVGFEDNYTLYFQGTNEEPAAFVEVKIFGKASHECYNRLTEKISALYNAELGIPKNRIYVKYEEVSEWGWNGCNF